MPKLILQRQKFIEEHPVQGSFMMEDQPATLRHLFIRSLELPWRNNEAKVSCIPAGDYAMRWTMSARFKRMMWGLDGVPDRSGVRIHSANYAAGDVVQLHGCIAPCMQWSDINKDGFIDGTESKRATEALETALRPYEATGITISIRNA